MRSGSSGVNILTGCPPLPGSPGVPSCPGSPCGPRGPGSPPPLAPEARPGGPAGPRGPGSPRSPFCPGDTWRDGTNMKPSERSSDPERTQNRTYSAPALSRDMLARVLRLIFGIFPINQSINQWRIGEHFVDSPLAQGKRRKLNRSIIVTIAEL